MSQHWFLYIPRLDGVGLAIILSTKTNNDCGSSPNAANNLSDWKLHHAMVFIWVSH